MKRLFKITKTILRNKVSVFITGLLLFVFIVLLFPFQRVGIGQLGVLYNSFTGNVKEPISPGWHYVIPFVQELTVYPETERTYIISRDQKSWNNGIDASIATPSNDNQTLSIDVTFVYLMEKDKLQSIYEKYNGKPIGEIEKEYFDGIFKDAIINTVSKYSSYDVYSTKRNDIQEEVLKILKDEFKGSGVLLKDVYINTVRLSEEMNSIIQAEALAKAEIIEAQGKSDANKLISDSLSEKIMKYESLTKLSNSLKLVIVPSGSDTDLDFSDILNQMLNQDKDNGSTGDLSINSQNTDNQDADITEK